MSAPIVTPGFCRLGICDGSGVIDRGVVCAFGGHPIERECDCAKRDTVPTVPDNEAALCRAMGCEGCPACVPGYIP